jgi:hypothetical protein
MATRVAPTGEDFTGLRDAPAKKTTAKKATATKAPTKKAAAKTAPAKVTASSNGEVRTRRSMGGRGWLAAEIDKILRKSKGEPVTVSAVAAAITNKEGEHPSSGAVAACFNRWAEAGYIKLNTNRPAAFTGYEKKWATKTLAEFLATQSEARKVTRAAAKASAKG